MKFPRSFSPLQVGPYWLDHRVVMAPLTRMRADKESFAPHPLNADYYRQRATKGGLIIAEASPVLATGRGGVANGSGGTDPMPLYSHVIHSLDSLRLAYLHFIEPRSSGAGRAEVNHQNVPSAMVLFRPMWNGVLIAAGGFTGETAEAAIAADHADAIAFGRIFISNPDLPQRLRQGFPLAPYNRATFYGGGEAGYTDYPVHKAIRQP